MNISTKQPSATVLFIVLLLVEMKWIRAEIKNADKHRQIIDFIGNKNLVHEAHEGHEKR
jgi:hypothetical protein